MGGFYLALLWAVVFGFVVVMAGGEVESSERCGWLFSLAATAPPQPARFRRAAGGSTRSVSHVSPLQVIGGRIRRVSAGCARTIEHVQQPVGGSPMLYWQHVRDGGQSTDSSTAGQTQTSIANPMGLSHSQMGIMMLASTAGMMGMGSGQLSGVRPGGRSQDGFAAARATRCWRPARTPADWRRVTSIGPTKSVAIHKVTSTVKLDISRCPAGSEESARFRFERARDCADCISCQERSGEESGSLPPAERSEKPATPSLGVS